MIQYYCGYPKCGKSKCAEDELRKIDGRVLYVGTLPNIQFYRGTIVRHKLRRPSFWELYDCSGDPHIDIPHLETSAPNFNGMIIDGLSYYVLRAMHYYTPNASWLILFRKFLEKISYLPIRLLLVDQPVAFAPSDIRRICILMHEELYCYSEKLYYVKDGNAVEVKKGYLRKRDGVDNDHFTN